jgi:hypothetical protein
MSCLGILEREEVSLSERRSMDHPTLTLIAITSDPPCSPFRDLASPTVSLMGTHFGFLTQDAIRQIRGLSCKLNTAKCAHVNLKSKYSAIETCDITIEKCGEMRSRNKFVGLK